MGTRVEDGWRTFADGTTEGRLRGRDLTPIQWWALLGQQLQAHRPIDTSSNWLTGHSTRILMGSQACRHDHQWLWAHRPVDTNINGLTGHSTRTLLG